MPKTSPNDTFLLLNKSVNDFADMGWEIYEKSIEVIRASQLSSGGTTASLPGTRYAGHVYPRDHGYTTRAFIDSNEIKKAEKALQYILICELSESKIMYQRYNEHGKNASYKPPQIDGNAQTIISLTTFIKQTRDKALIKKYQENINNLIEGIVSQTNHFAKGSLVYAINGIIEYAPFEAGYEIYTNAVCYRALKDVALLLHDEKLDSLAEKIKLGIAAYLYYPESQAFIQCVRKEPDVSYVLLPNLKSFLALVDFAVFDALDPKIISSLIYHLEGTANKELGGYNRYHYLMDRHNFGNGPWPMVMLRLAQYYIKANEKQKADELFTWVFNVVKNNKDAILSIPEHVASKSSFNTEYAAFKRINETAPRPAKEKEYQTIAHSKTYKELRLAYAVNPLVWSHAQFILAWNDWKELIA
jgi:GH15 family glucan-1,4-alpha-glucosidase